MNILEQTCRETSALLNRLYGKGAYHARAMHRELIKKGKHDLSEAAEFIGSPRLLKELNIKAHPLLPKIEVIKQVEDQGTIKFVTRLYDGYCIESVIIPMKQYNTLCISTQAGCRMGCVFCSTGKTGLKRNLAAHEITAQLYSARFILGKSIKNIVFMGMGEPLDNFDNVIDAIRVLNDQQGFDIALRHMTISTCGLVPNIYKLAQINIPRLNLAVSLNAPDNALRSRLMPVNRKYPLEVLKDALTSYPLTGRSVILIEYILFKDLNDSVEDALQLAFYMKGLKVRVNLIAFNPEHSVCSDHGEDLQPDTVVVSKYQEAQCINRKCGKTDTNQGRSNLSSIRLKPVNDEDIHRFASFLESCGIVVVKRWSKGISLKAGCGQLAGV